MVSQPHGPSQPKDLLDRILQGLPRRLAQDMEDLLERTPQRLLLCPASQLLGRVPSDDKPASCVVLCRLWPVL